VARCRRRDSAHPVTYLAPAKPRLKLAKATTQFTILVADDDYRPSSSAPSRKPGGQGADRSGIILDIFAQRRTPQRGESRSSWLNWSTVARLTRLWTHLRAWRGIGRGSAGGDAARTTGGAARSASRRRGNAVEGCGQRRETAAAAAEPACCRPWPSWATQPRAVDSAERLGRRAGRPGRGHAFRHLDPTTAPRSPGGRSDGHSERHVGFIHQAAISS